MSNGLNISLNFPSIDNLTKNRKVYHDKISVEIVTQPDEENFVTNESSKRAVVFPSTKIV